MIVTGVAAVGLTSCAVQEAPDGGPADFTPPTVIATIPAHYAVQVNDNRIVLEFSEYVDERSAEESIFISPDVGEKEFDWSGTELEIRFAQALRKGTTYVVNVGTDVADLHGINMAQSFTLAFSTGPDIDRGGLRGRVRTIRSGDAPRGIMVFAYALGRLNSDTLNPFVLKPDFVTQTGKQGEFDLPHLAFDTYRLVAVRDEYRNLLYDPETDEFGVASRDFVLTLKDTLVSGILLPMAKEDTTGPRVVRAVATDRSHVLLEFSENIDTSIGAPFSASIFDTTTGNELKILSRYPNPPKLSLFTLVTAPMDSSAGYRIHVKEARDPARNRVQSLASALSFAGSGSRDTTGLRVSAISVKDSSRAFPLSQGIAIQFNDAVAEKGNGSLIGIRKHKGGFVETDLRWLTDAFAVITPLRPLSGTTMHELTIRLSGMAGYDGRMPRDSIRQVRFETMDEEMLSSIEGIVEQSVERRVGAAVIVSAVNSAVRDATAFVQRAEVGGRFSFLGIPEGLYLVQAFCDLNGNGTFDAGRPFPFEASEPMSARSDTLKVRARWPLEGVRMELK